MQPLALYLALALPPAAHAHNERAMDLDEAGRLDEAVVALEAAYAAMPDARADLEGREQILAALRSVLVRRHKETGAPEPLCRLRSALRAHVEALELALADTPDRIELTGNRERIAEVNHQLAAYPPDACSPKPEPPPPEISSNNSSTPAPDPSVSAPSKNPPIQPTTNSSTDAPSPHSLRIAGGISLGLGAALLGVMTYAIVDERRHLGAARTLEDQIGTNPISRPQYAALEAHRDRARTDVALAVGTGISAAITTGLGVALLVLARKRSPKRVALAPMWLSSGTGVSLTLRLP